jgi:hypothetical protein
MENYIIDLNVDRVLTYHDFGTADSRARIAMDGFDTFDDIMKLDEKDVSSLADGFSSWTVATGKIIFGLRRTKLLKAAVNSVRIALTIAALNDLDVLAHKSSQRTQLQKSTKD